MTVFINNQEFHCAASKNKSPLDIVIVQVKVDFNRTVVCDSDCHFTNLCGDEHQSHVMLEIFLSWMCYCNSDSCKTVKKVSTNQTEKQLSTNGYNISHYQTDNSPFFLEPEIPYTWSHYETQRFFLPYGYKAC